VSSFRHLLPKHSRTLTTRTASVSTHAAKRTYVPLTIESRSNPGNGPASSRPGSIAIVAAFKQAQPIESIKSRARTQPFHESRERYGRTQRT